MTHISHQELQKKIDEAQLYVVVGQEYVHYKYPDKRYKVVGFGIQEATENVCVIYCDTTSPNIHFVRDLESWMSQIKVKGVLVSRFHPAYT